MCVFNSIQCIFQCKSFDESIANVCEHALEKLNSIFVHCDATVLQAAADACKHMLESQMTVPLLSMFIFFGDFCKHFEHNWLVFFFIGKYPLLTVFETGTSSRWPLKQCAQPLDLSSIFNDDAFSKSHSFWAKSLAIELFKHFDGESLAKVASKQAQFAVSMIPLLVKALLMTKNNADHRTMNAAVNLFFSKNFTKFSSESMEVVIRIDEGSVFVESMLISKSFRFVRLMMTHHMFISTKSQLN